MENPIDVMEGRSPVEAQIVLAQADQLVVMQWDAGKYKVTMKAEGVEDREVVATPREAAALMALAVNADCQEDGTPYNEHGDEFSKLLYPIAEEWLKKNELGQEYRPIP